MHCLHRTETRSTRTRLALSFFGRILGTVVAITFQYFGCNDREKNKKKTSNICWMKLKRKIYKRSLRSTESRCVGVRISWTWSKTRLQLKQLESSKRQRRPHRYVDVVVIALNELVLAQRKLNLPSAKYVCCVAFETKTLNYAISFDSREIWVVFCISNIQWTERRTSQTFRQPSDDWLASEFAHRVERMYNMCPCHRTKSWRFLTVAASLSLSN